MSPPNTRRKKRAGAYFVSLLDAVSQLLGRFIPYYDQGWTLWTRSSNESISGAAHWRARNSHSRAVGAPERLIDGFFGLFGQKDHCAKAFLNDAERAREYLEDLGYFVVTSEKYNDALKAAEARGYFRARD